MSAVTGAQPSDNEEDDEQALDDPLPDWVDLRVFILRPRIFKAKNLGTCDPTGNARVNHYEFAPWFLSGPIVWSLNRSTVPKKRRRDRCRFEQIFQRLVFRRFLARPRYPRETRAAG